METFGNFAGNLGWSIQGPGGILTFLIQIFFVIAGLAALFQLMMGTLGIITSGGVKENVDKAQRRMVHALIGLLMIVIVLSVAVTLERTVFKCNICFGLSCQLRIPSLIDPEDPGPQTCPDLPFTSSGSNQSNANGSGVPANFDWKQAQLTHESKYYEFMYPGTCQYSAVKNGSVYIICDGRQAVEFKPAAYFKQQEYTDDKDWFLKHLALYETRNNPDVKPADFTFVPVPDVVKPTYHHVKYSKYTADISQNGKLMYAPVFSVYNAHDYYYSFNDAKPLTVIDFRILPKEFVWQIIQSYSNTPK